MTTKFLIKYILIFYFVNVVKGLDIVNGSMGVSHGLSIMKEVMWYIIKILVDMNCGGGLMKKGMWYIGENLVESRKMTNNKQKIKCLFGFHKYDEEWEIDDGYEPRMIRKLTICTVCRKSVLWAVYSPIKDKIIHSKEMTMVKEVGTRFVVDTGNDSNRVYMHLEKSATEGQVIHLGLRENIR